MPEQNVPDEATQPQEQEKPAIVPFAEAALERLAEWKRLAYAPWLKVSGITNLFGAAVMSTSSARCTFKSGEVSVTMSDNGWRSRLPEAGGHNRKRGRGKPLARAVASDLAPRNAWIVIQGPAEEAQSPRGLGLFCVSGCYRKKGDANRANCRPAS